MSETGFNNDARKQTRDPTPDPLATVAESCKATERQLREHVCFALDELSLVTAEYREYMDKLPLDVAKRLLPRDCELEELWIMDCKARRLLSTLEGRFDSDDDFLPTDQLHE